MSLRINLFLDPPGETRHPQQSVLRKQGIDSSIVFGSFYLDLAKRKIMHFGIHDEVMFQNRLDAKLGGSLPIRDCVCQIYSFRRYVSEDRRSNIEALSSSSEDRRSIVESLGFRNGDRILGPKVKDPGALSSSVPDRGSNIQVIE